MELKRRITKLCEVAALQAAEVDPSTLPAEELDALIERELARLSPEEGQQVLDEVMREFKLDEIRATTTEA